MGLKEALIKIGTQQQRTLGWLTQNKIVFDSLGNDPSNWQHVAFSIYNDLCEVDAWAKERSRDRLLRLLAAAICSACSARRRPDGRGASER